MSENRVKIEVEVLVEVKRFLETLEEFTGMNVNNYLVRCMTQGLLGSVKPDCQGVIAFDLDDLVEKYGLDENL